MALLAGAFHDPASAAIKATTVAIAMTALDTTNLRCAFTAPSNGAVLVRQRGATTGSASNSPMVLYGVLEGSTVKARVAAFGSLLGTVVSTTRNGQEVLYVVPGLTPGNSYTWDAAYSVDQNFAGTNLKYGGPNDATSDNAWGGFAFAVHDCPSLLGAVLYDPTTAVTKSLASLLAMTAIDTTNLRISFTAPASGKVLVRMRSGLWGATTYGGVLWGVLDGSTVIGRTVGCGGLAGVAAVSVGSIQDATFIVTGLTGGNSYTWDAAYGVEIVNASSSAIRYGGPNNASSGDAWGAFQYEIWSI